MFSSIAQPEYAMSQLEFNYYIITQGLFLFA